MLRPCVAVQPDCAPNQRSVGLSGGRGGRTGPVAARLPVRNFDRIESCWSAAPILPFLALANANANDTVFGYEDTETERLMEVLSPHWNWNNLSQLQGIEPDDGGFTRQGFAGIIAGLVHVAEVTGHSLRPGRRAARS